PVTFGKRLDEIDLYLRPLRHRHLSDTYGGTLRASVLKCAFSQSSQPIGDQHMAIGYEPLGADGVTGSSCMQPNHSFRGQAGYFGTIKERSRHDSSCENMLSNPVFRREKKLRDSISPLATSSARSSASCSMSSRCSSFNFVGVVTFSLIFISPRPLP